MRDTDIKGFLIAKDYEIAVVTAYVGSILQKRGRARYSELRRRSQETEASQRLNRGSVSTTNDSVWVHVWKLSPGFIWLTLRERHKMDFTVG